MGSVGIDEYSAAMADAAPQHQTWPDYLPSRRRKHDTAMTKRA
jgi:hypothetical protein